MLYSFAFALAAPFTAFAQDTAAGNPNLHETPQPVGAGTFSDRVRRFVAYDHLAVAPVDVQVIDGAGTNARADQTVLIEGQRITAVGPSDSVSIPAGAEVIHLTGHTVIPGLVGMHDHTHMPGITLCATRPPAPHHRVAFSAPSARRCARWL